MKKTDKYLIRIGFVEPSYLLATGLVLLGVFVSVGGDLGLNAPVLLIGLVWALHLSVGLAAIRVGVVSLSRWRVAARWPDLLLLGVAGLLASLVLAPVSFGIDQWLLIRGFDTDDDPLGGPEQWLPGILVGMFGEWTQLVGPTLLVALLLGLPAWRDRRQPPRSRCALRARSRRQLRCRLRRCLRQQRSGWSRWATPRAPN